MALTNKNDDFFKVPVEQVKTSEGNVGLPILYYDVSLLMGFFWVEPDAVAAKLSGTGLKPVTCLNGKTIAGVALYAYHDTTVGIYNEVGVALNCIEAEKTPSIIPPAVELLMPGGWRSSSFYILDLPVTTKEANAAGREIWGYPKFVTEIPLTFKKDYFSGGVKDPDGKSDIFTLDGKIGIGARLPAFDLVTFTNLDGTRIKTQVNVRGSFKYFINPEFQLKVGTSGHKMAQNLKDLGLAGASPFALAVTEHNWQSRLNKGSIV